MKIRSAFKCHGGKFYLNQWIIAQFPKDYETMSYIEPFCGGANVLLHKIPSKEELINDIDGNITLIMQMIRDQLGEFVKQIKKIKYKESTFQAALEKVEFENEMERAVNEFILRRMSRGGMKKAFAWSNRLRGNQPGDVNAWKTIIEQLPKISDRLQNVYIINRSAIEILKVFDDEKVLCYCLPPWQKLRKENEELLEIEKIKEGDILFDGRKVLKKMSKIFDGNLLKIKIQGVAEQLEITQDHKLLRIKKNENKQEKRSNKELWSLKEVVSASEIEINDYLLLPLGGKQKEMEFKWSDISRTGGRKRRKDLKFNICPELYRYFGYYAAEGHIGRNKKGHPINVVLSFNKDEMETWIKDTVFCVEKAFGIKSKIGPGPHNTPNVIQVTINSTTIAEFTSYYVKGTATNKCLHQDLMTDFFHNQKEILKCWLRGDGGIEYSSRNRIKLLGTSSSIDLAKQMYTIALRCGLKPSFKQRQNNFDVYFASEDAKNLGYFVPGKSFRSTRKIINNCMLVRVKDIIKNQYCGPVYDINVDKDHLFVSSFVLVHNCDPPYLPETRESPNVYDFEMSVEKHMELADVLNTFKGKVLISGYPSRLYNRLYKDWKCESKKIANHSSQQKIKATKTELLWRNF